MSQHQQVLDAFVQLGKDFGKIAEAKNSIETAEIESIIPLVKSQNAWFTENYVRQSFAALSKMLEKNTLQNWLSVYGDFTFPNQPKNIAIIMAGNIPMVGFHDLLCVLISGNRAIVKLSSDDRILLPAVMRNLSNYHPELASNVSFAQGLLSGFDAVIATGSNNTSRYFEAYFGKYPNIIRKGRNSVAVLEGDETEEEMQHLAKDVFDYYGLGCRNVTKLYIPENFDLDRIFNGLFPFAHIVNHNKYANNYDYHKSLWLLNREELLDNGFILLKLDTRIASPIGTLFYERYPDRSLLNDLLNGQKDQIQCIVGKSYVPFGQSQCPALNDYADGVDTMKFLQSLC